MWVKRSRLHCSLHRVHQTKHRIKEFVLRTFYNQIIHQIRMYLLLLVY